MLKYVGETALSGLPMFCAASLFRTSHSSLGLSRGYFKAEEPLHLAEYRKAVQHLTIYSQSAEEKKLRSQMMLDFAKLQGYEPEQLKKLEDALARAKDIDEGIAEFRKLGEEHAQLIETKQKQSKNIIVKGQDELLKKLDDGFKLVQPLADDKFLMKL